MQANDQDDSWIDDEWEDTDGKNIHSGSDKRHGQNDPSKQLTYEEEERIAIRQEGCNKRIDVVLRYPIDS